MMVKEYRFISVSAGKHDRVSLDCGATPCLTCTCIKCTEWSVQWRGFPLTRREGGVG